ncbi:CoA transferase [Neobacillus sp. MM2021_6]|uniref:CaiB/BaiF CoA transferase family protein n=1 Tax=Bacillaceae TaxID=186817 RepID=UPI00140C1CDF|nr:MULTISPECIES: CoA transferase [Bacillaceae]MBO0959995.1 CoA transferase [Neobacillus sp. MM2021_6]NHC18683.1 CoA transferase [Bacillus sp. MM2020_4]
MKGPLTGIRVIDLTSVLMGPYCTQLLGDMGADIIKIETEKGDSTRYIGPSRNKGMASAFLYAGRNKRSIVLDLKKEEGKRAFFRLVEDADVFVHSSRPQAIERLGLTYEEVKRVNPSIIYCGAYGFSKKGPYREKPAYDDMIQGASGLAALQGEVAGTPQYMATVLADKTTGLMMMNAILAALYSRERTGEGQEIEVPMFETMISYSLVEHMYGLTFDPPMDSSFYPRVTSKYRKPYKTKDGYISVIVYNDKQWFKFFEISGHPELKDDPRFRDIGERTKHIDQLYQMVEEIIMTRKTDEWLEILENADIPVMPVYRPEDMFNDPHLKAVHFFEKVSHPSEGSYWNIKNPIGFSKTPIELTRFAPRLGEHSAEVLEEVGYSQQEIQHLLEAGVIIKPLPEEQKVKNNK